MNPFPRCRHTLLLAGAFALLPTRLAAVEVSAAAAAAPPVDAAPLDIARIDAVKLDATIASFYPAGDPGAAILLAQGDEVLLRRSYGLASIELGVPIEPQMVFRIGSITKQFTAVAILLLAEQGKLRLDQTVAELLPDYPREPGGKVRVDQLLSHSSGIPGYTENPEFWKNACKDLTRAEMLGFFAEQPLLFPPGDRFSYSNSGYYLLGLIVEKVSGETYGDFVERHLFAPAGMSSSRYDNPLERVPGRVAGHQRLESGEYTPSPYVSMHGPFSAGALASTVDDLRRWNDALLAGKLISRASLEKAWTPYTFNDGKKSHYGFGWNIGKHGGERIVHHAGGVHGFLNTLLLFPDKHISAVVLSNGNGLNPNFVAERLAMAALGESRRFETISLPPEDLVKFEGVYRISETSRRVVRAEGGKLVTIRDGNRPSKASPLSPTEFLYDFQNDRFRFELDDQGRVQRMVMLRFADAAPEVAERTSEKLPEAPKFVELPTADLDKLVGRYALWADFEIAVRRKGAGLVIQATGQSEIAVEAVSPTELHAPLVGARLVFTLEQGKATSLILHQGGQAQTGRRID